MFCTKCGTPVSGSFCVNCGTPVAGAVPPGAPPPVAVPPAAPPPAPPAIAQPGGAVPVPAFAPVGPVFDYALWSTRVFGFLIDFVLVGAVAAALGFVAAMIFGGFAGLGGVMGSEGMSGLGTAGCCVLLGLFPIATLAVGVYNKVYLVAQRGASIGQGIMHIKVVDGQGGLLTFGTALIRLLVAVGLGFILPAHIIDLLWPLWDDHRQTLHDKAVNCYVINQR